MEPTIEAECLSSRDGLFDGRAVSTVEASSTMDATGLSNDGIVKLADLDDGQRRSSISYDKRQMMASSAQQR
jgi:hypothetical protein